MTTVDISGLSKFPGLAPFKAYFEAHFRTRCFLAFARIGLILSAGECLAKDFKSTALYMESMNELAHEHSICVAYYVVAQKCFGDKADDELKGRIKTTGIEILSRAREYGREAGLDPNVAAARTEMAAIEMTRTMSNNCSNISLVMNKHAYACKSLSEDPVARFEQILKSKSKRRSS